MVWAAGVRRPETGRLVWPNVNGNDYKGVVVFVVRGRVRVYVCVSVVKRKEREEDMFRGLWNRET